MAATRSSRLEPGSRTLLLETAAEAIESQLERRVAAGPAEAALPAELRELRASFVTLTVAGELRGCCGTLEARRALATDVWHNARASAFGDPRFPPLERGPVRSAAELLARLVPGEDGLVIAWRGSRATFLPKVWEQLRDPVEFLAHLKRKAGWAPEFWAEDVEVWRYFTESAAAPGANRRP